MWLEFKIFFQKDLRESQAFINGIWSKFRKNFQYQLKKTQDYAFHLQQLQSILVKFSTIKAPNKPIIICYF